MTKYKRSKHRGSQPWSVTRNKNPDIPVVDWQGIANDPSRSLADSAASIPVELKARLRANAVLPARLERRLEKTTEVRVTPGAPFADTGAILRLWRRGLVDMMVVDGTIYVNMTVDAKKFYDEHRQEILENVGPVPYDGKSPFRQQGLRIPSADLGRVVNEGLASEGVAHFMDDVRRGGKKS